MDLGRNSLERRRRPPSTSIGLSASPPGTGGGGNGDGTGGPAFAGDGGGGDGGAPAPAPAAPAPAAPAPAAPAALSSRGGDDGMMSVPVAKKKPVDDRPRSAVEVLNLRSRTWNLRIRSATRYPLRQPTERALAIRLDLID